MLILSGIDSMDSGKGSLIVPSALIKVRHFLPLPVPGASMQLESSSFAGHACVLSADDDCEAAEDDDAAVGGGVADAGGHEVTDEDRSGAHEDGVRRAAAGGHVGDASCGQVA